MKSLLVTPEMIKMVVDGSKTVMRRLDGLTEINQVPNKWGDDWSFKCVGGLWYAAEKHGHQCAIKSRYRVGELVYIKEAYNHYGDEACCGDWTAHVKYKLDGSIIHIPFVAQPPSEKWWNTGKPLDYWQSPLFMPEKFARSFIRIVSVRPERLQEITLGDCELEGIEEYTFAKGVLSDNPPDARWVYIALWDSINKKPGTRWADNPLVFRYEFEREAQGN